jgi:hypothetical protein
MKKLIIAVVATAAALLATVAALLGAAQASRTGATPASSARASSTGATPASSARAARASSTGATPASSARAARASSTGATPASSPGAARASRTCTVTIVNGPASNCGPYSYSPQITASHGYTTYVGIDGWACGPASRSHPSGTNCGPTRLTATDPGHWHLTTTEPKGNTGVLMYPSVSQLYDNPRIKSMTLIRSGFTEAMPHTPGTVAWAAYDMFLNGTGHANEVMIHTEVVNGCPKCSDFVGHATFAKRGWTLRNYGGGEWVWTPDKYMATGTVHILAMLKWMIGHGHLRPTATLGIVGFGWEICSTGGVPENFSVSNFWLHTK